MTEEDSQKLLGQAQLYQQQMQGIMTQKEALKLQRVEIEKALAELEKTSEKEVFKISGPILIKEGKPHVKKDLNEKKDAISLRIKTLEKGEAKIKGQLEELKTKLSKSSGQE